MKQNTIKLPVFFFIYTVLDWYSRMVKYEYLFFLLRAGFALLNQLTNTRAKYTVKPGIIDVYVVFGLGANKTRKRVQNWLD